MNKKELLIETLLDELQEDIYETEQEKKTEYDIEEVLDIVNKHEKEWWYTIQKDWSFFDEYLLYWNWKIKIFLWKSEFFLWNYYILKEFDKLPEKYEHYFFDEVYN